MGGDRIEADVGEEDDGSAREHPQRLTGFRGLPMNGNAKETYSRPVVRRERVPVSGIDEESADANHKKNRRHLDAHHNGVEQGALANPFDQHRGNDSDDQYGREINVGVGRLEMTS